MGRARLFAAGVTALGVCLWAAPASAFGPFAHGLIAERAYGQLLSQHPWLAPHREAFIWGALAPDLVGASLGPDDRRARASGSLNALWRAAGASGDRGARAFVLGWAVHVAAEDFFSGTMLGAPAAALRRTLGLEGPAPAPGEMAPLVSFAVDAALVPVANGTLAGMNRAVAINTLLPAGAPMRAMLAHQLGIDDPAYLGWARYQAALTAGGPDRYLALQGSALGIGAWAQPLQTAAARQALGELRPVLTRAVDRGLGRAEELLAASPVTRSAVGR